MPRNPDRCPTHPGALLREDVIPATGVAKAEIARLLGISRQHLHDILEQRKPVSPPVRPVCRPLRVHAVSACDPRQRPVHRTRVEVVEPETRRERRRDRALSRPGGTVDGHDHDAGG